MNRPEFVHAVEGYNLSRDYKRGESIRDVAKTIWDGLGDSFAISSHGITYVHGFSKAEFLEECHKANVEFFPK